MTVVLSVIAMLALVLTVIEIVNTTDQSFARRADGCPMHRIDGSVKYSCKHQAVVRKAKNEN
jgi:hypothetical protein